jgi:hypothetical protein
VVGGGVVVWDIGRPARFDLAATANEFAGALDNIPYPQQQAELVGRLRPYIEDYYASWEAPEPQPYISYNSKN